MLVTDIVDPAPTQPEKSITILRDQIFPMYLQYWEKYALPKHSKAFSPHLQLLLEMWFQGGLKFLLTKDNGVSVGFATCVLFRPLQFQANVLQIHDFFAETAPVAQSLFDYIDNMSRLLNCDEIWYEPYNNTGSSLPARWVESQPMTIHRYLRRE